MASKRSLTSMLSGLMESAADIRRAKPPKDIAPLAPPQAPAPAPPPQARYQSDSSAVAVVAGGGMWMMLRAWAPIVLGVALTALAVFLLYRRFSAASPLAEGPPLPPSPPHTAAPLPLPLPPVVPEAAPPRRRFGGSATMRNMVQAVIDDAEKEEEEKKEKGAGKGWRAAERSGYVTE